MDTLHIALQSTLPTRADRAPVERLCERLAATRRSLGALGLVVLFAGCEALPVAPATNPFTQAEPPRVAVGDAWVYRISNGYNHEVLGQVRYQVEKIDAGRTVVSATPDKPSLGQTYTVVYTPEGNWLQHPVASHGQSVEYQFAAAYPAYVFPLQPEKSWSLRVSATDTALARRNSVRVDGTVIGTERIRVPAGEFDTIKIRRLVYAGDWDGFKTETRTYETDWYAPALGRAVRMENKSQWRDMAHCTKGCPYYHGDWNVMELSATSKAQN